MTFLLVVCIMLGACYGTYRYLTSTGYVAALAQSFRELFRDALNAAQNPELPPATPTPAPVQPGEEPQTPPQTPSGPGYDEEGTLVDPDEALYALLYNAAQSFTEEVDIAHLGYTSATLEPEVARFFFTHPDLFYVDNGYSVYTSGESSTIKKIRLRYLTTQDVAQTQLAYYNGVLDEVVGGIPAGATDFETVLYLHDYLVQNYAYDYEGLALEQATGESLAVRDAYNFFYGKKGVCQAYMLAMIALCEEAGISCLPVTSDAMAHAWNLVELDGEWYHVDVTWDDAGGEQSAVYPSYVSYQYFLLSGEALYHTGRTAQWLTSETANASTYDAALWRAATTPLCKNGEDYFCVVYDAVSGAPTIFRGTPVAMTAVQTIDAKWFSGPSTYYRQSWASIVAWEDVMLISTATGFLYYDRETNALSTAAELGTVLDGKQIFGVCGVSADGTLTYVAAVDYKGSFTELTWKIPTT